MSRKSKAAEFVQEGYGYNITITGRNVLITDPMKAYAMEKISKIERFSSRIIDVVVIMDIQKLEHRVDILIKVGHLTIKSQANTDNMYASIDKAVDKIEAQLRRYKKRIQDHQTKPVDETEMTVNILQPIPDEELFDINDEIEDENLRRDHERYQFNQIVKQETIPLKALTSDEAVMKLDLSGDKFLIFRNEKDRKINILYKKEDGNFGLIEAKD